MKAEIIEILKYISKLIDMIDEKLFYNESLSSLVDNYNYIEYKSMIKKLYNDLSKPENRQLSEYLKNEFGQEPQLHVFILSIILGSSHNKKIIDEIFEVIITNNLDPYYNVLIEFELAYEIFANKYDEDMYRTRRQLHSFNVNKFKGSIKVPQKYIPYNQRNKDRIVIITEQILNVQHAPSKIILEYCYTLQKELNKNVLLIVCPTNMTIDDQVSWFELKYQSYISELSGNRIVKYVDGQMFSENKDLDNRFIIQYKDIEIKGQQVLFDKFNFELLQELLFSIYTFNPLFVYNIGCVNPVADTCKEFTTVVSSMMSYGFPVSDGDILLSLIKKYNVDNNEFNLESIEKQGQIVMKESLQFTSEISILSKGRLDFGIKDDEFVIAIVGNRLKEDITEEFKLLLSRILQLDKKISLLIIGEYINYSNEFSGGIFNGRVHYIGFQPRLNEIIGIADVYLNPPRNGGGISALIALAAGVPVMTLPIGDVAENVSENFIYFDIDKLIEGVCRLLNDKEYYNQQKKLGIDYSRNMGKTKSNMKNKLDEIENVIIRLEKGKEDND